VILTAKQKKIQARKGQGEKNDTKTCRLINTLLMKASIRALAVIGVYKQVKLTMIDLYLFVGQDTIL
jgi:hypothetical protein